MPSRQLALCLAGLGILGLAWPANPLVWAAGALLLGTFALDWLGARNTIPPRVKRPTAIQVTQRRPFSVTLQLTHAPRLVSCRWDWPSDLGDPRDEMADCEAGTFRRRSVANRRGVHTLGPAWIVQRSPLGFWRRRCIGSTTTRCTVLSDLKGPNNDVLGGGTLHSGTLRARHGLTHDNELDCLRRYSPGDDPRHVDWKTSARRGHPVVRNWRPQTRRRVTIALDAGRLMTAEHDHESKFDAALRMLLRVAIAAQMHKDSIEVVVFDRTMRVHLPSDSSAAQMKRIQAALLDVQPVPVESSLASCFVPLTSDKQRRSLIVVTDVMDAAGGARLQEEVRQVSAWLNPFVVLLRDPSLDQSLRASLDTPTGVFKRAAAELTYDDRDQCLRTLRAKNVPCLDVSMASIAADVVAEYTSWR